MTKTTSILVVLFSAGASIASTVPVQVEAPSLSVGISIGALEAASGGGAAGGVAIAAMGEIGCLLTTGNVVLAGGMGGDIIEDGEWNGGGYFPASPGLGGLGDLDTGAVAPRPPMNTPVPSDPSKSDGGGSNTIVTPLPGAGMMGMAGLLCVAGATRRRRM